MAGKIYPCVGIKLGVGRGDRNLSVTMSGDINAGFKTFGCTYEMQHRTCQNTIYSETDTTLHVKQAIQTKGPYNSFL